MRPPGFLIEQDLCDTIGRQFLSREGVRRALDHREASFLVPYDPWFAKLLSRGGETLAKQFRGNVL
jgi:hypothetical protein